MNIQELKKIVCKAIDAEKDEIIKIGNDIFKNPELGYKEFRTSNIVNNKFKELGLDIKKDQAITGVSGVKKGKSSKAKICVVGELDGVIQPKHKYADKDNSGVAHACGHSAQIAVMLGAASGIIKSGVMDYLDGDISFLASPAEEFVDLEYRQSLRDNKKIKLFGGKQELIREGYFDDIDLVIATHAMGSEPERKAMIDVDLNGFVAKRVIYKGKAAHAGAQPHKGINALNAALIGMTAINTQRETFRDEDNVRVHPIITKGGDVVNTVPDEVILETYVRANSIDAIINSSKKINRALEAGAYAVGGTCEIQEIPGNLPLDQSRELSEVFYSNIAGLIGEENIIRGQRVFASGDIGDVSSLLPTIQPNLGGFDGTIHGEDFHIADEEMAYIIPAKAIAMTIIDLLVNDAQKALEIKKGYKPIFNDKESYEKLWDNYK